MKKHYDFSKGKRNPYARRLKKQITIRLDEDTLEYFKQLAAEAEIDTWPITYLKNKTADLVREVSEKRRPVIITQSGVAKVVVMDVETYDRSRAAMALLEALAQGEADLERGRTVEQPGAKGDRANRPRWLAWISTHRILPNRFRRVAVMPRA